MLPERGGVGFTRLGIASHYNKWFTEKFLPPGNVIVNARCHSMKQGEVPCMSSLKTMVQEWLSATSIWYGKDVKAELVTLAANTMTS